LRHAKTIVALTVILAVSLAPAITLRFFRREAISSAIESRTGFPGESVAAVWVLISFIIATLIASALMVVLARAVTKSARGSS
jgi:hypothetical protein